MSKRTQYKELLIHLLPSSTPKSLQSLRETIYIIGWSNRLLEANITIFNQIYIIKVPKLNLVMSFCADKV